MRRFTRIVVALASCLLAADAGALSIQCVAYDQPTLAEGGLLPLAHPGAVAMAGDLACVVDGSDLIVVDASCSELPRVVGNWTTGSAPIEDVVMGDDFAVVRVSTNHLIHLDLRDPTAPAAVPPAYVASGEVGRLAAAGDRVCVHVGAGQVVVLAQADGLPLTYLGALSLTGTILGLAAVPTHAYVVRGNGEVTTVGIAGAPVVVRSSPCYLGQAVTIGGDCLVVDSHGVSYDGDNQPVSWRQIETYSLANPAEPAPRGGVVLPAGDVTLAGTGNSALVWWAASGDLLALETSSPQVAGALCRPTTVLDAAGGGVVAVASTSGGCRFYDVASPVNAGPQALYFTGSQHVLNFAAGGRWLVSGTGYWHGFSGYNRWYAPLEAHDLISDEMHLVFSIVSTQQSPTPVPRAVSDDLVVFNFGPLYVMRVADESYLGEASTLAAGDALAAIHGTQVLVAEATRLALWDCTDPANAVLVDDWPLDALPVAMIAPRGPRLVVLAFADGRLEIADFGDLGFVEFRQLPEAANALTVSDTALGLFLICGTDGGFSAVHIGAYPDRTREVGPIIDLGPTEAPVVALASASYPMLYATLEGLGVRVYTFSGSSLTTWATGGPSCDRLDVVTTADPHPALIASRLGLAAAIGTQCDLTAAPDTPPAAVRLGGAAPNPFNPRTSIHFAVERDQRAVLALFDARGRRVRTLVDGIVAAGAQMVDWDGRDDAGRNCATGLYVVRLAGETGTSTSKLMLVR